MPRKETQIDLEEVVQASRLNEGGYETLDDTPVSLPVRLMRGENIASEVQRLVQAQLSMLASNAGYESWEESNDFEVGDDWEPESQYEVNDFSEEAFHYDRETYYRDKREQQQRGAGATQTPQGGTGNPNSGTPGGVQQGGSGNENGGKGPSSGSASTG